MSEIKQSADSEMMRLAQTIAVDICHYIEHEEIGVALSDQAVREIGRQCCSLGLLIRQQTAARCAEIADEHECRGICGCTEIGATIRAEFEVKE